MPTSIFFNVQNAPIGAFASFTLGARGARGGLGLELGHPADQPVFIGLERAREDGFDLLPFCESQEDPVGGVDDFGRRQAERAKYNHWEESKIRRALTASTDEWTAGDLRFKISSPVGSAPDPMSAPKAKLKLSYAPAITVEITVDNRRCKKKRRIVFGFGESGGGRAFRRLDFPAGVGHRGIAYGDSLAIATDSQLLFPGQGFSLHEILSRSDWKNLDYSLGRVGALVGWVPGGRQVTFRLAVCFYRSGPATTGIDSHYLYRRWFDRLEDVASFTLANFKKMRDRGSAFDKKLSKASLGPDRSFMLAHAVHSYYASTELLEVKKRPLWVVNEGEYRMMNTLDLTVDQLPFEMALNPWTIGNVLDWFVDRYSYVDQAYLHGDPQAYPGGLVFCHDMGVANHMTKPGRSAYELAGAEATFSSMAHEELLNWLACGLVYARNPDGKKWALRNRGVFAQGLQSMLNRDHPDPDLRDGVMSLDSSRCNGRSEITTYDSLDAALSQARENTYLAVKSWGVYVGLEDFFHLVGNSVSAKLAGIQARRVAKRVVSSVDKNGILPAILGQPVDSRIIPAIEGLLFPYLLGKKQALTTEGPYGELIAVLKKHFDQALIPGQCLLPDGGWKISSTSNNTWLSKIYLCQFVAEHILKFPKSRIRAADRVHAGWLKDPRNDYWAWSDQIIDGIAIGSKYYPRGVTSWLWLTV